MYSTYSRFGSQTRAAVMLSRITGRKVAFIGSCLLALDPFYITHSKVLHVDGLLATFMFVSTLFLFSYLYRAQWLDLIFSGVFAGLSFLTKSPSLFIVPYAILALGAYRLGVGSAGVGTGPCIADLGRGGGRGLRRALASDVGPAARRAGQDARAGHLPR